MTEGLHARRRSLRPVLDVRPWLASLDADVRLPFGPSTTSPVLDIIIIAVSVVVGVVGVLIGTMKLRAGPARTIAAAVTGGLLAGIVSSELAIESIGTWWADHPSTGAIVTGVLLATLTLLVVEAAVQHALDRAEDRRWKEAAGAAAGAVLDAVAGPMRTQLRAIYTQSDFVMDRATKSAVDMGAAVAGFASSISVPVIAAAPVLTATERLHEIYEHALRAARAAAEYEAIVEAFAWGYLPQDPNADPHELSQDGKDHWWLAVADPWQTLRLEMKAFADAARGELNARASAWDFEPWEETGSEAFERHLDTEIRSREYDPTIDA